MYSQPPPTTAPTSPNALQPPSAAPRTLLQAHPCPYPYAFPSQHSDPADRPHAPAAAEDRTDNDHTLTNNALYHRLLSERPPHADASSSCSSLTSIPISSSSSSSSSEGDESGYRECSVSYREEAPVPGTEVDAGRDTPTDARAGGVLIGPLQPQALAEQAPEKKKKSVSFAKTVNVRHYPEDSYPDMRKFEEERRSRRRKNLGLGEAGEEGNEDGEDGGGGGGVVARREEEGKEGNCEPAVIVVKGEDVNVEERKKEKGQKKSLEGIRGAALNFFRRLK